MLLVKAAATDILHVYLETDCEDSHMEIRELEYMDRLILRGNKC